MDPTPGNKETGEGYDPRFAAPFLTPDVITTSFKNGKYPHSTNDDGKSNTYYFLRLGEVYYIHAEAEAGREAIILRQPVPVCKPFWMPMSREYMTWYYS